MRTVRKVPNRSARQGSPIKTLASELRFRAKFFLGLLVVSYALMRLMVYLTRVLAHYFVYGEWRFF